MFMMAATLIKGKYPVKTSSLEPKGQWPFDLVCNIRDNQDCTHDSGLTLTYFATLIPNALLLEQSSKVHFSVTV